MAEFVSLPVVSMPVAKAATNGGGCCGGGGNGDGHAHGNGDGQHANVQAYGDVFTGQGPLPYGASMYVGMGITTKTGGRAVRKRKVEKQHEEQDYDSRTEAQSNSTAAKIDKEYHHAFPVSQNPDKTSRRREDGYVNSSLYANNSRFLRGQADPKRLLPQERRKAMKKKYIDMDYHHPLEDVLDTRYMRKLFGWISKTRSSGKTMIEEIIQSYGNPKAPMWHRIKYLPFHLFINRMKGSVTVDAFRERIGEHASTIRGFVIAARSVAEFGLTLPQRFVAPLFIVWNFTNLCNLTCKHCYQDAEHKALPDELSLKEKLKLVDQIAEQYVPMIAFAGGEPTISADLLPVLKHCHSYGIHTTIATHGGTMTEKLANQLLECGVKYVEISLDSVHPERHDDFRGQVGMWHRTVRGMRNVVKTKGLRLGVAMCVHQGNFDEVEDMLQFCCDIGAGVFAHFNFIPVGRGLQMVDGDLNPQQREWLLKTLNLWMQSGKIGVISTAPQFGRVCVAHAPTDGKQACSHAGSGGGEKARVIAKYLGGCGAGRDYVAIEPNGNITPCVYLPHRVQGSIRKRSFIDIFRNNEFWELLCDRDRRTHHCEVCEFKHYCGGCRARADAYFGELNAGDPGCVFNEKHWDDLVQRGIATDPDAVATADRAAKTAAGRQGEIDELYANVTAAARA
ncbi:Antilisterial bacteriocin subtilosin biosynthesis protein AlbA [Phycisphaerae bacterium RAS1]|nr:Antilisterial bacteriocin subtilosin biosynthesis protein AlbA [Phycisphaerae bacterium RAS1]